MMEGWGVCRGEEVCAGGWSHGGGPGLGLATEVEVEVGGRVGGGAEAEGEAEAKGWADQLGSGEQSRKNVIALLDGWCTRSTVMGLSWSETKR